MTERTGEIRAFKTPENCQKEIETILNRSIDVHDNITFAGVIGMKLRKRRLELKLTQTKVSIMLGVTFQQVQKYECGMNSMNLRNLWKFCIITDTDINWFFEDIKKKNEKLEVNEPIERA